MNQIQMSVPLTRAVKYLIIANVAIWVFLILVVQRLLLGNTVIFDYLALIPFRVVSDFWVWQIFTYMFLHSTGVFHVLFNMLTLWWFGSELESRWGSRFFLTYYFVCGAGAGIVYLVGALAHYWITGGTVTMATPLVGASGATYGLLLAYGLIFGERDIFFMMLFPMKAKFFVMIIGAVELVTLLDSGMGSAVANLAHLGGLAIGFLFLAVVARMRSSKGSSNRRRGRRLKLVVDNERDQQRGGQNGPRYWN
jgi:membrane associated rhomboid family serine protease